MTNWRYRAERRGTRSPLADDVHERGCRSGQRAVTVFDLGVELHAFHAVLVGVAEGERFQPPKVW
jgi:hypothetical protein